jgi:hypothetical protein
MEAMSFMNAERRRERMRGTVERESETYCGKRKKRMVSRSTPAPSVREQCSQKRRKTAVLRRYIFYEMQADQAVKAIQFAKLCVLVVIIKICNSHSMERRAQRLPAAGPSLWVCRRVGKARERTPFPP